MPKFIVRSSPQQIASYHRQRRTARRKAEREAKAREEEARQAALAARADDVSAPTEHSDEESTQTVTIDQTEASLTAERE